MFNRHAIYIGVGTIMFWFSVCFPNKSVMADETGKLELSGKLGYYVMDGGDLKDTEFQYYFNHYNGNNMILGGGLEYYFMDYIGVSFMVDYYGNKESFQIPDYTVEIKQRLTPVMLNAMVKPQYYSIHPYAGIGIGAYFWKSEIAFKENDNSDTLEKNGVQFGLNVYGGLQWTPGGSFGLFAEMRYLYTGNIDFIGKNDTAIIPDDIRENLGGYQVSGGVTYTFNTARNLPLPE